jgi:hypothetical protein
MFLSGSIGSSKILLSVICTLEINSLFSQPKVIGSLHSTAVQMQYEPAISTFELKVRLRQIAGNLQDALEAAVCYFQLMIAPAFGDHGVAANAAHYQLVLRYQHLDILEFHSGKIELDLPPFRAPVDVDSRLPQWPARPAVFAADSLDKNPLAS